MEISIVVCTYDRLDSLKKTLASFAGMRIPPGLSWQVVIVDNNSPYDVKSVVEEFGFKNNVNVKYILESKQGKCNALNSGIKAADGGIIAFTDDDNVVDKEWIAIIWREFEHRNPACIGGKILPIWEKPPPSWLRKEIYNCIVLLDLSPETIQLREPMIYGCNMAIRKSIILDSGLFNVKKGPIPGKTWGGEEVELLELILKRGGAVYYCPDMLVHHCIPLKRMQKAYYRKWKYDSGEFTALHLGEYKYRNILEIPLYAFKNITKSLFGYLFKLITSPCNSFYAQLALIKDIGFIIGRIRYKKLYELTHKLQ